MEVVEPAAADQGVARELAGVGAEESAGSRP
jgi:hypothetical protein